MFGRVRQLSTNDHIDIEGSVHWHSIALNGTDVDPPDRITRRDRKVIQSTFWHAATATEPIHYVIYHILEWQVRKKKERKKWSSFPEHFVIKSFLRAFSD